MATNEVTNGSSVWPVNLLSATQAAARCEMSDDEWSRLLGDGTVPSPSFLSRDGVVFWDLDEVDDWCAAGQPRRWQWARPGPNLEGADRSPCGCGVAWNRGDKFALLAHYASRLPKQFTKYDGFALGVDSFDDLMGPDAEGHCLSVGMTWELMAGADVHVHVLIPATTSKEDAVALLKKVADWIERDGVYTEQRQEAGTPS
jgi:hypothetical protein